MVPGNRIFNGIFLLVTICFNIPFIKCYKAAQNCLKGRCDNKNLKGALHYWYDKKGQGTSVVDCSAK